MDIDLNKLEQIINIIEKALTNVDFQTVSLKLDSENFDDVPQEFDEPDFQKFYEPINEGIQVKDIEIGSYLYLDLSETGTNKMKFDRAGIWRDGTKVKVLQIVNQNKLKVLFPNGSPEEIDIKYLTLIQDYEIHEMSTSGGAGAYDSAAAFSKSEKDYNSKKKRFEKDGMKISEPNKDPYKRKLIVPMEFTNKGYTPLGDK